MTIPGENLGYIICLGGRSDVYFSRLLFTATKATAIYIAQQSRAHIENGIFKDGIAPSGAGFIAGDNSTVELYSSTFLNNTANGGPAE